MMALVSVVVLLVLALIIGAALSTLPKTRKSGVRLLSGTLCGLLAVIITVCFIRRPVSIEKTYLEQPAAYAYNLREHLDRLQFYLGAALDEDDILGEAQFSRIFNSITPENALKMGHLLIDIDKGIYDFSTADRLVDTAISRGVRVRGHALVFGKLSDWFKSPDLDAWLKQFPENERSSRLAALLENHIRAVLEHFRGRIMEWDVVNEPLALFGDGDLEKNVFHRYLGEQYIADSFHPAHRADPSVKLILNEQFALYTGPRADAFIALLESLQKKGVPLSGVGLQGHMMFWLEPPERIAAFVRRIAALGLTIEFTELEARLRLFKDRGDPYRAQGEYYRDVIAACLDIPGFTGVTFWGYADDRSWLDENTWLFPMPNEPYLLDAERNFKPAVGMLDELFHSKMQKGREGWK